LMRAGDGVSARALRVKLRRMSDRNLVFIQKGVGR
jgi:hypothetical protein